MNGDANLPHRSSSPLKRRASSMDPEEDNNKSAGANTSTTGAETGPTIVARAMSVDMPDADGAAAGSDSTSPKPSLTEQVKVIETLLQAFREAPVKDGDKAYLVSRSWVDKALALRSGNGKNSDDADDATLGPIDNSDIIEEQSTDSSNQSFTRLKPGSGLEEFELFPEDAWNMVMDWYGIKQGQQPIVRTAIESASNELGESNVLYEFHPTIFKAHRLWSEISPLPIEQSLKARNPPPLRLVRSRKYHAQTLVKELKELSGIPLERRIRLWTVPEILPAADESRPRSALTPPDSPGREDGADNPQAAWPNLLIDLPSFKELGSQKEKLPLQDQTVNPNYNGRSTLQQNGLVTDQTLVLEEHIEKAEWVSTYIGRSRGPERSLVARGAGNGPSSRTASGRNSPTPSGPNTRGRVKSRHGRSLGAVGLHNLGNTCYMNSALQCVRSVEELTKYFLTDTYVDEVNKTNPLGYHGKVALAYVGLLRDIYAEGRGSVSPRDFKNMVGRCRSTFAGWGQQDSQEFLGFLLDALQEDLSRIVKKPYIEKPDSTDDMINDPEAIRQMAEQVWDITRKRDDSVIADLFTGMYKSTLKCPECGKISITFDPFNNLTLPLPIENMWTRPVKFFPLNDAPVLIDVELPKHSAIDALRQFISERTGVPVDRLIGAEEYNNTFFKVYDINQDVSEEIRNSDVPTVHELEATPTNWPVKGRKPKIRSMLDVDAPFDADDADDPRYEKMVVPVFHRRPDAETRQAGASPPHFIVLNRAEASDYVAIRRKVLEKVATFSTWTKFNDVPGSESAETGDSDAVVMTASDADSSGESKVAARSVEGEDDMLDISMQNGSGASKEQKIGDKVLKHFNRRRPACARTEQALDPELSQLFDLSYFHEHNNGSIPTGWQKLNYGGSLPKVSDRIPESSTEDGDDDGEGASPASWNSTASGNEDSSGEDASKEEEPVATRMNDESSEDDMPKGAKFARRPAQMKGSRKKFKDHKAYGKKGNKRRDKVMRNKKEAQRMGPVKPQPTPPAVADGGPLIRLDEGLVVDWKEDAWEAVFGSSSKTPDSFQGAPTFVDLETLHDPALKQNQRRRQTRRSRGITLEECLDEFERAEVLSEQDMWYCPRCKEHRRASKKFDLWKTPDILVAHLKRFSSSGYRRDKLDVLVDFPVEGLDLTSRVIQKEDGQDEIYDLIAVDDHYGGLGGGHYTAYARNFADGEWYNYNDSSVSKVKDTSSVVTSAAYLLFYRRRSSKPLGGPRFAKIIEQFNQTDDESEDELANSGEVQRLGGRSSPAGSLRQGQGAAAVIRPRPDRHETTTTVRALDGSDDEDLPSYSEPSGGDVIHNSIEADEGIDMADPGQPLSFNALQAWNFEGLNSGAGTPDNDYASDTAQADMSVDDHDMDGQTDVDTEMDVGVTNDAFDDTAERRATDTNASGSWDEKEVLTVPSAGRSEASSDVAEIRLDSDKNV